MVRFKVRIVIATSWISYGFTFQYGKIQSTERDEFGNADNIFTFQYGKIQRPARYKPTSRLKTFIFQYGKIQR